MIYSTRHPCYAITGGPALGKEWIPVRKEGRFVTAVRSSSGRYFATAITTKPHSFL